MEQQEKLYFQQTKNLLDKQINDTKRQISENEETFAEKKKYLSDNFFDLTRGASNTQDSTPTDLASTYSDLNEVEEINVDLRNSLNKLIQQRKSPYFARIDFKTKSRTQKVYIGISAIREGNKVYVCDWRAPISSMFYDFTVGPASYKVDKKTYSGEITLKRQYRIENDNISYFDTTLTIEDEILQDVLSKNSSSKMKQIVSTIQKEQNIIVRTEEFDNLLVQGVAGSGKTSIALHRAAYLLYTHRKTMKASDILIMSPNNIFSSYISEVLPQLGEENLVETSYDQIAKVELKMPLESREEMLDRIASSPTQQELNEISFKSSFEYLGELIKFLRGDFLNTFTPATLKYLINIKENEEGEPENIYQTFTDDLTSKLFFDTFKNMTINERLEEIASQYTEIFSENRHYSKSQKSGLQKRFKKILYNFLPIKDVKKIFEIFMARLGLTPPAPDEVGYMDKGAMLIIKYYLYGFNHDFSAKYLIVDEMQDFTPVDLYIFKKLWSCPSIFLGDINQCIEKTLSRDYLKQVSDYLGTEMIELKKTYRSTREIAEFAHGMIGLKSVEFVNRSGEKPKLYQTSNIVSTIQLILDNCSNYAHIAIICKCQNEVDKLKTILEGKIDFKVLQEPDDYNCKVVLTTCATAKGIEFDCVIVPNVEKTNYVNSLDKNILYVSSTRALHRLYFISSSTPTQFLKGLEVEKI